MNNQNILLVLFLSFAILFSTASCILTKIPTASLTPTPSASLTLTATASVTATATDTLTPTPTDTLTPTATPAPTLQPGDFERQVTVDGQDRNYLLYIPSGLKVQQPVPVVFVFHGYRGSPSGMQPVTGYNDIADLGNFLVVYPEGLGKSWNAGNCCGHAVIENVDEPAFIRQILSDLGTITGIDPKRIYGTGWSNGAALTYRLACEMSEIFAAIGPVSGSLGYSPCHPQQPVSIIHVHGLADNSVPYSGGGPFEFPPVEQGIDTWVQLNNCSETGQVEIPYQALTIIHTTYTSCQAGTIVELFTLDLGTHAWPRDFPTPVSEYIWEFFAAHPKP